MCLMIDRLILSRLESLSALLQVFQIFRGRAGARLCDLFRSAVATLYKSHRLAIVRIKVVGAEVLSDCRARAGKTLISRSNLSASGSCRALRACPLWHLWPISASASQTRKPSTNTIGPHTFARLSLITSPPSSPARRAFLGFIFSFGTDLIRSFFVTYVLKSCRAVCLLIAWFACSGSRLCGQ